MAAVAPGLWNTGIRLGYKRAGLGVMKMGTDLGDLGALAEHRAGQVPFTLSATAYHYGTSVCCASVSPSVKRG